VVVVVIITVVGGEFEGVEGREPEEEVGVILMREEEEEV